MPPQGFCPSGPKTRGGTWGLPAWYRGKLEKREWSVFPVDCSWKKLSIWSLAHPQGIDVKPANVHGRPAERHVREDLWDWRLFHESCPWSSVPERRLLLPASITTSARSNKFASKWPILWYKTNWKCFQRSWRWILGEKQLRVYRRKFWRPVWFNWRKREQL